MNTRSNSGFTLIEVMVVCAIIGTLAMLAVPFYQDYVVKTQVSEGVNLASQSSAAVAETYMQIGEWPEDNASAGLGEPEEIQGKYVTRVEVIDGTLAVTFGGEAHEAIRGKTLSLEPAVNTAGDVIWACGAHAIAGSSRARTAMASIDTSAQVTNLPSKYLPESCRA